MTELIERAQEITKVNYAAGLRFLRGAGDAAVVPGRVILEPDRPAQVGQVGTWTLSFSLPEVGLFPGGVLHCHAGNPLGASPTFVQLQGDDPEAEGYVTAWAGSTPLSVDTRPVLAAGPTAANLVAIRSPEAVIPGGTEIRIVLGDRSQGSKGARLPHYDFTIQFWLSLDPYGEATRLDWADVPTLEVRPGAAEHLRLTVPSQSLVGEPFLASLQAFDTLDNPAPLQGPVHVRWPGGGKESVSSEDCPAVSFDLKVDQPGLHRLWASWEGWEATSNPIEVTSSRSTYSLYWGEIHGHSSLSDGTADPDDYFAYGRDVACLDFCALTDHDTWLTPEKWAIIGHTVARYRQPGRFVTFLGFEWSSAQFWTPTDRRFGHKNVYHLGEAGPYFNHLDPRYDTPEKLWAALDPTQSLTIAHHPAYPREGHPCWGTDWDHHDDRLQPLVEIYSKHGLSESPGSPFPLLRADPAGYVQEALARGYHLGFVGGSDTHLGRPGSMQAEHRKGARHPWSGLTAVYAPRLTRPAIFQALRARRTYATTGARILMRFHVNGAWMGQRLPWTARRRLSARVAGTAPLTRIEVVRNNQVWREIADPGTEWSGTWEDADGPAQWAAPGMAPDLLFYYLRVIQEDGHMAWSSPIWVEGGA